MIALQPLPALPTTVAGALTNYEVLLVEAVDPEGNVGEYESLTVPATIKILAVLPPWWQWQTFFHECLHMIEEEQSVDLTEDQVERISLGLFALWLRNKWAMPGAS